MAAEGSENGLTQREAVGLALRKRQLDSGRGGMAGTRFCRCPYWITLIQSKSFTFVFIVTRVADSTPRI